MTLHQPVLLQPAGGDPSLIVTGQEYRNSLTALLSADSGLAFSTGLYGNTTAGFGGVVDADINTSGVPVGSMAPVQRGAGANFSVDVGPGWAFVIGNDVSGQGVYAVWNDATVNVATPTAPGSGTRVHRLVLQVQDKLNSGFTGYQAQFVLQQDTGSGTPPITTGSPSSSSGITLALVSIAAGQVSVQNANITDYRRNAGPSAAYKPSNSPARTTAGALADDPDLQLWGLQNNASYAVTGMIFYHGTAMTLSSDPGGLTHTFRVPGTSGGQYMPFRLNATNNLAGFNPASNWTGTLNSITIGPATTNVVQVNGGYTTGTTSPNNYLVFQWALLNGGGSTVVEAGSYLRAVRVG